MERFKELTFTPGVKGVQARMGSRSAYARSEGAEVPAVPDALGEDEVAFLAARDSFYLASLGEGGWPYVQHRGGSRGFVQVLDPHTLAFPDFRGNRQYISVGNLAHDARVALIFVDYPNQARLKVLARAQVVTEADDPALLERLSSHVQGAKVERAIVLRVEGYDWNCPQHIVPRYTAEEIQTILEPMRERLTRLEQENQELRRQVASFP